MGRGRAIAYVSGGEVRLVSRNDKDMAASYPELAVLAGRVGAPVILDGEIVALRAGRPDFGALRSRMHVRRPPARSTRRSRRQAAIRSVIATLIPCSRRVMFSKLNGLTCFLAPLLPAPHNGTGTGIPCTFQHPATRDFSQGAYGRSPEPGRFLVASGYILWPVSENLRRSSTDCRRHADVTRG